MSSTDDEVPESEGQGFGDIIFSVGKSLNLKIAVLLFLTGMFVFSDTGESFLPRLSNRLVDDMGASNSKGTVVQLLVLCVLFLIFDFMVRNKYV